MPIAVCIASTLTVITNPVNAATAPTIAASEALAVVSEYCQKEGRSRGPSEAAAKTASAKPATPPRSGITQRLPFSDWRRRNRRLQDIG